MTDSSLDVSTTEAIADDDWLYRRLALNHLRSDGTVNRTAFMRNSVPPNTGKEPDPQVSVDLARLTVPPTRPQRHWPPLEGRTRVSARCRPDFRGG